MSRCHLMLVTRPSALAESTFRQTGHLDVNRGERRRSLQQNQHMEVMKAVRALRDKFTALQGCTPVLVCFSGGFFSCPVHEVGAQPSIEDVRLCEQKSLAESSAMLRLVDEFSWRGGVQVIFEQQLVSYRGTPQLCGGGWKECVLYVYEKPASLRGGSTSTHGICRSEYPQFCSDLTSEPIPVWQQYFRTVVW
jgi:hypothetical protein